MIIIVIKPLRLLHCFDGIRPVFKTKVNLGKSPVGDKRREGDNRTPVGLYKVCAKNPRSKYHLALALNYPNGRDALIGLLTRRIDMATYKKIVDKTNLRPPFDTPLGGFIMLHGQTDKTGDWTAGCIAMPNAKIETLYDIIQKGTRVIIL